MCRSKLSYTWFKNAIHCRDVPNIRFRLAGYPVIFQTLVPAKTVPGTGYLNLVTNFVNDDVWGSAVGYVYRCLIERIDLLSVVSMCPQWMSCG